jgi:uncharacterized protein YrrD
MATVDYARSNSKRTTAQLRRLEENIWESEAAALHLKHITSFTEEQTAALVDRLVSITSTDPAEVEQRAQAIVAEWDAARYVAAQELQQRILKSDAPAPG